MSDLFDEEPRGKQPPAPPSRRSRALVITAVVLVAAFFLMTAFASIYTDRLWFRSVDYGQVFTTLFFTRVLLFLVFGLLMGLVVGISMYLAYRHRPLFRPGGNQSNLDRYRDAVTPVRTWLMVGVAVVVGGFAGTSAMGQWRSYLLWRNAQPFDRTDAYFNRDIGFYVFQLPWWHYLVDFTMAATVIAVLAAAVVHYLYGGIRLQVSHDRLTGAAQVQLSVLLGIFVLAKAVDYFLDRYDLVLTDNSLFTGMNHTAHNALLPAKNILLGVALICAILFFLNAWRRTWQLPSVGLGLLVLSSILLGMIWPAIVQQFQVNPSEADKEASYIQANMEATRDAYDLSDVQYEDYESNSSPDDATVNGLVNQVSSVPLVDPQLVRQTFQQRQQPRDYYAVSPVLDVDRYQINGQERALVLGAREIDQQGLNEGDRNWNNLHTVYTHGNGLIAAYANQRPESNDETRTARDIEWAEGIQAGQNALSELEGGYRTQIYFGENSPEYSIVGKNDPDDQSVELGLAGGAPDQEAPTTYDGEGGVPVGGLFNQFMYAVKYGEPNFLLSERVHGNSRVLYERGPMERVQKVAPWLTVDSDAYPAVIDGRVQWIVDAYTTTDRFPNAQRESFSEMIDDSLQQDTGFQTLPTDEINYMRQAVKATVDAYDGTVTLYAWDESDPILKAWRGVFPDSVKDKSEIPDEVMQHLRYPEDLFKAQRFQLARYHVENASDWYQGSDRWEVPTDPNAQQNMQPPYRLFTRGDGTDKQDQWSLTSVMVPFGKENLAAYVSVDSDATSENFGKMRVFQLSDTQTSGPGIIATAIANDDKVRDVLREFEQSAAEPIHGNLLTLPVRDGLMHIEPIYALRGGSESSYPILQFAVVSYGNEIGIGRNLTLAMADALGVEMENGQPVGEGSGQGNQQNQDGNQGQGNQGQGNQGQGNQGEELSLDQQIVRALQASERAFAAADEAAASGDMVERERQLQIAQQQIDRAIGLAQQRDANEPAAGE